MVSAVGQWTELAMKRTQLTGVSVDLAELVVGELVHQAVEELGRAFLVDSELTLLGVVVRVFDVSASLGRATDADHPHELVDIFDIQDSELARAL